MPVRMSVSLLSSTVLPTYLNDSYLLSFLLPHLYLQSTTLYPVAVSYRQRFFIVHYMYLAFCGQNSENSLMHVTDVPTFRQKCHTESAEVSTRRRLVTNKSSAAMLATQRILVMWQLDFANAGVL